MSEADVICFACCSMLLNFASSVCDPESRLSTGNTCLQIRPNTVREFLPQRCPQRSQLYGLESPRIVVAGNGCGVLPKGGGRFGFSSRIIEGF